MAGIASGRFLTALRTSAEEKQEDNDLAQITLKFIESFFAKEIKFYEYSFR